MNRREIILLSAFGVALLSAFAVYRLFANAVTAAHRGTRARIVAAADDIKLGTILKASDLKLIEIGSTPSGAIAEKDVKSLVGRGVISDLYRGEPILESRLAAMGSGGGLAAAIPPGMRACAIKVDDVVSVSGFVTPGMHVDVIVSGNGPSSREEQGTAVRTLLQNLKVLSAGTDYQTDAEGKAKQVRVVNLLVTPEEAQSLSLASSQTHIQLVLRNPLDTKIADVPGNALGNLLGGRKPQPKVVPVRKPVKPVQPTYTVEILNGSKGSVQRFGAAEGLK